MKPRILRITFLVLAFAGMVLVIKTMKPNDTVSIVRAFGTLTVTFPQTPLFNIANATPGDSPITKTVTVDNGGTISQMIAVRGVRTGGAGTDPKIETTLDLVIKDGSTPLYGTGSLTGPKTVADFFTESANPNGVMLGLISPGGHKTYSFTVSFPSSAGNEFQAKSVIFDLTFGVITGNNLVINEVYYRVDDKHGLDSPKDRGILGVNGNKITIKIQGNGTGSTNTVVVDINQACTILQSNSANSQTSMLGSSSTGGNIIKGNSGGSTTVTTGNAVTNFFLSITGSTNSASCRNKLGQNDEWVEIYNPTNRPISLKDWSLTDNSGNITIIHPNKSIPAGGFAILAKDASTFKYWSIPSSALKVELGQLIGDGLDNGGDHLILKDNQGNEVDRMSWGSDTSGFTPPATNPIVSLGDSTERLAPGFDTNAVTDWHDQHPPTPGN
jgi:hypothetical protein